MPAGGWNKGIKNSTGVGFKGGKHSEEAKQRISESNKASYKKPKAEKIVTNEICDYGCDTTANYKFSNGKLCCSTSFNSCQGKRRAFSEAGGHNERAKKSLATRKELGITKSTGQKAKQANLKSGHYDRLKATMQEKWDSDPWQNNPRCPIIEYKETGINYQGSFEYNFLQKLEDTHGTGWLIANVSRGPNIWYTYLGERRLYISDFLIGNTVYEIKSQWTWNKHGKDKELEMRNKAKLKQCLQEGYNVKLILDGEERSW